MKRSRKKFSAAFKSKVAIEALKEQMTIQELSNKFEVHPNQISIWKSEFLKNALTVFEKNKTTSADPDTEKDKRYKVIGQQKIQIDFLKKVLGK
jgi:transposase-like protein